MLLGGPNATTDGDFAAAEAAFGIVSEYHAQGSLHRATEPLAI